MISSRNTFGQNALGVVGVVLLVPVIAIALPFILISKAFERPTPRSAEEVAFDLRNFIEGTGDEGEFDHFVSVRVADEALDSIRERAKDVPLPADEHGLRALQELLAEAEALIAQ
jgi:hypothetical protein